MKLKSIIIIIAAFLIAPALCRSQENIWFANGEKALFKKDYAKAIEDFSSVLDHNPSRSDAYYKRGMAYLFSNKFNEAVEDMTKSIETGPPSADVYNARGLAYGYIGNVEMAITDFDKAIEIEQNFTEAYINRGSAYVSWYNFPAALKDFDKAIKLDDKNPAIFYQRALIQYKNKKYKKAVNDYSKAIKLGLIHAKVYYNRGNAYFKDKNWKKAIKDYSKAIELDPKDTEARNNRAMAYDESGNKKKAEQDRKILNKTSGNKFPPVETLKFKSFDCANGGTSIKMPDTWHFLDNKKGDVYEFWITQEKMKNKDQLYSVGVWISFNNNMSKHFKIDKGAGLLEFWKASNAQNADEYEAYDVFSQKQFRRNGYDCILNKTRIIIKSGDLPVRMYELVMAKDDMLIFGYFRAPERQFGYYKKIYDKAIESFWPM